jgi:phosphoenolpyruvate carboxykinase (ATP)
MITGVPASKGLERYGITNLGSVRWNLSPPALYEEAIRRSEGQLAHFGPLVVNTGRYTGRSPNDKFIVRDASSEQLVWWGDINRPMEPGVYDHLRSRVLASLQNHDLFVQDCFVGAATEYRLPIRVIATEAWHALFAHNMFIRPTAEELAEHAPQFTVIHAPRFKAQPEIDHTNSEAFIILNFGAREVLIGGTSYAGEIKKSIFSVMNFLLPQQGVLPMHCSANTGSDGDLALFFGLSGTGKTTLSITSDRTLVGDDEHGWTEEGVFNFEGGCYAKVIRLSKQGEPEIYATTQQFGTILENVGITSGSQYLDLNDDTLTENTRASFPISFLTNASPTGIGPQPANVVMLSADAFGVMPPISRLTPEQAVYYFLSGYTARVGGTERGVTEPQATFSPCFGAPFMALHPSVYAKLLKERLSKGHIGVWLVNTGWSGGAYGVGSRIQLSYTRAMLRAALDGALANVEYRTDQTFGLQVPMTCPGMPAEVLDARSTWADLAAYDEQAKRLAGMFVDHFQQFADTVDETVLLGGPHV